MLTVPLYCTPFVATVLIAFSFGAAPARGQTLFGSPVMLDVLSIGPIRPSFKSLDTRLTDRQTELANVVLNPQGESSERLQAARDLLATENLPYPVERWVTISRIKLAAEENLSQEMEEVAFDWLRRHPDSRAPLSPFYRQRFSKEPDINMTLRTWLGHMYMHLRNDAFDWPGRERYARFQEFLAPLIEDRQYMAAEELDARFWFASRCPDAASWYLEDLHDAVERGEFDPERLSMYAEVFEAMAQIQQARLYESVRIALENALSNPEAYHREESGFVPEYMILDKLDEVRRNSRSAGQVTEETRERLSGVLAENGFKSVEAMWEALMQEAEDVLGPPGKEKQAQ